MTPPDYSHPELQALLGRKARLSIRLRLVEQIIEDPGQEFTAMDMEYWDDLHDKLKVALQTAEQRPA